MGRSARESTKQVPPIRFRLTEELLGEVDSAWKASSMRDLDRQNFLIYLIREGLIRHKERENSIRYAGSVQKEYLESKNKEYAAEDKHGYGTG